MFSPDILNISDNFWSWAISYIRSLKRSRLTQGEDREEVRIRHTYTVREVLANFAVFDG